MSRRRSNARELKAMAREIDKKLDEVYTDYKRHFILIVADDDGTVVFATFEEKDNAAARSLLKSGLASFGRIRGRKLN